MSMIDAFETRKRRMLLEAMEQRLKLEGLPKTASPSLVASIKRRIAKLERDASAQDVAIAYYSRKLTNETGTRERR